MSSLADRRRFFAEEIEAVANLQTSALVDALATVPREDYLPPGPWTILSLADYVPGMATAPRVTPDADPKRVYHNVGIAIDPSRQLFNGHPGTLAGWIDALALAPGARVLHVGCGPGYYTAVMAHTAGPTGRVVAYEIDEGLAAAARQSLRSLPGVEVRHGDASETLDEAFDAILVNAGVTHPHDAWLEAIRPAGRLVLPLTATMPAMGTIGKGFMAMLTPRTDGDFDARLLNPVAIYSGIGLRDEALNAELGKALMRNPFPRIAKLRRDPHEAGPQCWLHAPRSCLT